jgi:hypothetical protein
MHVVEVPAPQLPSAGLRRRRRNRARPTTPLRLISTKARRATPSSPADLVADLAALVDAGAVEAVRDGAGAMRYRVFDIFAGEEPRSCVLLDIQESRIYRAVAGTGRHLRPVPAGTPTNEEV